MWRDLRLVLSTWPRPDRWRLGGLVGGQFVASLFDLLGIAAVLPLMQILMGDSLTEGYLSVLHRIFGKPERAPFVVMLAGCMVLAFALKAALSLLIQWWQLGFVLRMQRSLQRTLLEAYLETPFHEYKRRDTAEVIRLVGTAVTDAMTRVVGGLVNLVSQALSIVLILGLLLVTFPVPTVGALIYFALAMGAIQAFLVQPNKNAGKEANRAAWRVGKATIDITSGFREIRMHDAKNFFLEGYDDANKDYASASRRANFFGQVPRHALEFVTIAGVAVLLVIVAFTGEGSAETLPTLTLFIAAAVKMLPILAAIAANLGIVSYGRSGLSVVGDELRRGFRTPVAVHEGEAQQIELADLEVRDLAFTYEGGSRPVLDGIDLDVPAGSSLAICGASGSGKTTAVDVILGLLEPLRGTVRLGEVNVSEAGGAWRSIVAYVPQDAFVLDATLAQNVGFGLTETEVDRGRVEEALRLAHLDDLVRDLPNGMDTLLGEAGKQLSGGQRQRLGIARALYRKPSVIILDEATSALDNSTEDLITQTIQGLRGVVTTIIVAHRLSTVRRVDQLVFLKDGRVAARGSFEEVAGQSPEFAELVRLGDLSLTV